MLDQGFVGSLHEQARQLLKQFFEFSAVKGTFSPVKLGDRVKELLFFLLELLASLFCPLLVKLKV